MRDKEKRISLARLRRVVTTSHGDRREMKRILCGDVRSPHVPKGDRMATARGVVVRLEK